MQKSRVRIFFRQLKAFRYSVAFLLLVKKVLLIEETLHKLFRFRFLHFPNVEVCITFFFDLSSGVAYILSELQKVYFQSKSLVGNLGVLCRL